MRSNITFPEKQTGANALNLFSRLAVVLTIMAVVSGPVCAATTVAVPDQSETPRSTSATRLPSAEVVPTTRFESDATVLKSRAEAKLLLEASLSARNAEKLGLALYQKLDELERLYWTASAKEKRDQTLCSYARQQPSCSDLFPKLQRTVYLSREMSYPSSANYQAIYNLSYDIKRLAHETQVAASRTCVKADVIRTMHSYSSQMRVEEACQWARHMAFVADEIRPREISVKAGSTLLPVPWDEKNQKVYLQNLGDGMFVVTIWKKVRRQSGNGSGSVEKLETNTIHVKISDTGIHEIVDAAPVQAVTTKLWDDLK